MKPTPASAVLWNLFLGSTYRIPSPSDLPPAWAEAMAALHAAGWVESDTRGWVLKQPVDSRTQTAFKLILLTLEYPNPPVLWTEWEARAGIIGIRPEILRKAAALLAQAELINIDGDGLHCLAPTPRRSRPLTPESVGLSSLRGSAWFARPAPTPRPDARPTPTPTSRAVIRPTPTPMPTDRPATTHTPPRSDRPARATTPTTAARPAPTPTAAARPEATPTPTATPAVRQVSATDDDRKRPGQASSVGLSGVAAGQSGDITDPTTTPTPPAGNPTSTTAQPTTTTSWTPPRKPSLTERTATRVLVGLVTEGGSVSASTLHNKYLTKKQREELHPAVDALIAAGTVVVTGTGRDRRYQLRRPADADFDPAGLAADAMAAMAVAS